MNLAEHRKKASEQGALTSWSPQKGEPVRTQEESNRARDTHNLETTVGLVRTRKGYDRARGTHFLETAWGETVRTRKECSQARGTHCDNLEIADEVPCQDTEGK